jgi:hypothetical protein
MRHAKPLAGWLALLAGLAVGDAAAQQAQAGAQAAQEQREGNPQAQEEQAGNAARQTQRKPDEQPVQGQPQGKPAAKAAPQQNARQLPRRRAVPAVIGTMPAPSAPQAYGPVLHEVAPQTTMPAPAPGGLPAPAASPGGLPAPATITGCVGNQCNDTSGKRYQTGVGNTALDSNGHLCTRNGQTMQCF